MRIRERMRMGARMGVERNDGGVRGGGGGG